MWRRSATTRLWEPRFHTKALISPSLNEVAVEVPHKPSESPIMLSGTVSKLLVEGLCNYLWAGWNGFLGNY